MIQGIITGLGNQESWLLVLLPSVTACRIEHISVRHLSWLQVSAAAGESWTLLPLSFRGGISIPYT